MNKLLLIIVATVVTGPLLSAWDTIVDFAEFAPPHPFPSTDPGDPIAQLVRITDSTDGVSRYGMHYTWFHEQEGSVAYYLRTEGHGVHEGRLDAAIELDRPIEGKGTLYLRFMREGWRTKVSFGLSAVPVSEDPEEAWGWTGPSGDGARAAGVVNYGYWLYAGDGDDDRQLDVGLPYDQWHEIWMTVDVEEGRYRVYHRIDRLNPAEPQLVSDGDEWLSFRGTPSEPLRTVMISTDAGDPDYPNWWNTWLLDAVAVDSQAHNLSDPPFNRTYAAIVEPPAQFWGFFTEEFGGEETWISSPTVLSLPVWEVTYAPWVYDVGLRTWLWVPAFRSSPDDVSPANEPGLWVYILNSGVPDAEGGAHKWGFPEDEADQWKLDGGFFLGSFHSREAPWIYSYSGHRSWIWVDLLTGAPPEDETLANQPGTWAYMIRTMGFD